MGRSIRGNWASRRLIIGFNMLKIIGIINETGEIELNEKDSSHCAIIGFDYMCFFRVR